MTANDAASESGYELVITRVFAAPRDLVFRVWTDPNHLAHWWGPKGVPIAIESFDLRPGGMFLYSLAQPEGQKLWGKFVYREIAPPERLVFLSSFTDAAGTTIRNPWSATWPLEILNIVTFSEHDGKTTITMRGGPHAATAEERATFAAASGSVQQGLAGTLDQLEAYLAQH